MHVQTATISSRVSRSKRHVISRAFRLSFFLLIVTFKKENADLVIFEIPPNRHLSLQTATDFAPNRHLFLDQLRKKKVNVSSDPLCAEGTSLQSSEIAAAGSVLRRLHRRSLADYWGERLVPEELLGTLPHSYLFYIHFLV